MRKGTHRLLAFLLCGTMVFSGLSSAAVYAEDEQPQNEIAEVQGEDTNAAQGEAKDIMAKGETSEDAADASEGQTSSAQEENSEPAADKAGQEDKASADEIATAQEAEIQTIAEPRASNINLTLNYRERDVLIVDSAGSKLTELRKTMYLTLPSSMGDPKDYTYYLAQPDEEEKQIPNESINVSGLAGRTAYWSQKITKAGAYTLSVKKDNETVAIAKTEIVKVIFDTGDKGAFSGDKQTTYEGYGMKEDYLSAFDYPSVTVNGEGEDSFLGWGVAKDATKVISKASEITENVDGSGKVYAVYGFLKTYTYEFLNGEQKIESLDNVNLGTVNASYSTDTVVKTLKIKNTGNQAIQVSSGQIPNFVTLNFEKNGQDIPAGEEAELKFTLKAGLSAGYYEGTIGFWCRGGIFMFKLSLTVGPDILVLTPPENQTKKYGVGLSQEERQEILKKTKLVLKGSGQEFTAKTADQLGVQLRCEGYSSDASAGTYDYSLLTTSTDPNYKVEMAENIPSFTVSKDTPQGSVNASGVHVGAVLRDSVLSGSFVNSNNPEKTVDGKLVWDQENLDETLSETPARVEKNWRFIPDDNTNYEEVTGSTTIIVSERIPTNLTPDTNNTFVYNGSAHSLGFTSDRPAEKDSQLTVTYRPAGTQEEYTEKIPVNAGTYDVRATMDANESYARAEYDTIMVIEKKEVGISLYYLTGKSYDGTTDVDEGQIHFGVSGKVKSSDDVQITLEAVYDLAEAGSRNVAIRFVDLTGKDSANYRLPDNRFYHTTAMIMPKELTITPKREITKPYGKTYNLTTDDFTIDGLVQGESPLEFISEGELPTTGVGTYPISASLTSKNYKLKNANPGDMTVTQVTPVSRSEIVAGEGKHGWELNQVTLNGEFVNPNDNDLVVKGSLNWDNPNEVIPDNVDTYTASWTFTVDPSESVNYTSPVKGEVTITLVDKTPIGITAEPMTVPYDGQPHRLTVAVDPASAYYEVKYRKHPEPANEGIGTLADEESAVDWSNWSTEEPVNAGVYDVSIKAIAIDELAMDYADSEILSTLTIIQAIPQVTAPTKMEVPEGTKVEDVALRGFTGVDGNELEGVVLWTTSDGIVDADGEEFRYTFIPSDSNYTFVTGSVTFTLAADPRTIMATVYNLPNGLGFSDYAVVDIKESGLNAGDYVIFQSDADGKNPESESILVTEEDIANGKLIITLDRDALKITGGTIYARISSSQKNRAVAIDYIAEPGVALVDSDEQVIESIVLYKNDIADAMVVPSNTYYTITDVTFSLSNADGVAELIKEPAVDDLIGRLRGLGAGEASLIVSVTFDFPDPDRSDESITIDIAVPVICAGSVVAEVTTDATEFTAEADPDQMRDAIGLSAEDKENLLSGAEIDFELSVKGMKEENVPLADIEEVKKAAGNYNVAEYLDIDLTKTVKEEGNTPVTAPITEIKQPITIKLSIPQNVLDIAGPKAVYSVIRVHNGNAEELKDQDNDPATVTIATNLFSTYAIVYHDPVGNLMVGNTVTGTAGDPERAFSFTVKVEDNTFTGTYGDMTFKDGVATFTLKHGESATATDIPAGIKYTVTEEDANKDGYTTTSEGTSGTIIDGETARAVFTNNKDKAVAEGNSDSGDKASSKASPQTGDNNHIVMWSVLMIASLLCAVITVMFSIRRRSRIREMRRRRCR